MIIKGTIKRSCKGYTSQFPSCATRRFIRNTITTMVQMAVVVPTRGNVPMIMPLAMLKASICGVSPCLIRAVIGVMMYFLKNP